jgi:hypothetical protein
MLQWRFVQAGGKVFPFENGAIESLYEQTKGHPRSACGLAKVALEFAGDRNTFVSSELVGEVSKMRFLD